MTDDLLHLFPVVVLVNLFREVAHVVLVVHLSELLVDDKLVDGSMDCLASLALNLEEFVAEVLHLQSESHQKGVGVVHLFFVHGLLLLHFLQTVDHCFIHLLLLVQLQLYRVLHILIL